MKKSVYMTVTPILSALLVLGTAACSDSGAPRGIPDLGSRPKLTLLLESPNYLETNVNPDMAISAEIVTSLMGFADSRKAACDAMVVEAYPSMAQVQGICTGPAAMSFVRFQPSASLAQGDYIVRFPSASSDLVVLPRPYNVFRVGSAHRLTRVELLRDKQSSSTDLVRVALVLSELLPAGETVSIQVQAKNAASQWLPVATTPDGQTGVKLATALDPQLPVRITVSSQSLDGKWTGVAGSGPITAELVPKDYQVEPGQVSYPVPPELSVELPSGLPKK